MTFGAFDAEVRATDVRSWRNDGKGLYPGAKVATDWEEPSRVEWQTPLAATGNGCPILVGGKLIFTAEPATLICADAATGKILWRKSNEYADLVEMATSQSKEIEAALAKAKEVEAKIALLERELYRDERRLRRNQDDETLRNHVDGLKKQIEDLRKEAGPQAEQMRKPPAHDTNGYSSYTPVTDGKHVWACFGTSVVVCYDFEGKRLCHNQVNKNRYYSSSLVHEGIVYLITRDYQMQALEAATGDPIYSEKIVGFTGTAYPSLTLAGDVIFVGAEDGNAAFIKPGRNFEEISRTKVAPYRSTPIFQSGLTYLRTHEKLLAIHSN